jgi:hypothetical protein
MPNEIAATEVSVPARRSGRSSDPFASLGVARSHGGRAYTEPVDIEEVLTAPFPRALDKLAERLHVRSHEWGIRR